MKLITKIYGWQLGRVICECERVEGKGKNELDEEVEHDGFLQQPR